MIDVAKVVSQATKQLKGRSQMSHRYLTSIDSSAIVIAFALLAPVIARSGRSPSG
jgi:phenylalanyl-tRNA synthetase beta subunit